MLALYKASFFHLGHGFCQHGILVFQCSSGRTKRKLFLSSQLAKLILKMTHISNEFLSLSQSTQHDFLGNLLGTTFYHGKAFCCSCYNNFQVSLVNLLVGGVNNVLSVNIGHTNTSNGAVKRNVGNNNSGRTGDYSQNVRWVHLVGGNTGWYNLNLTAKGYLEQGAHGAVNKAGNENFLVLWATFTLNKSTGNLSSGVVFFVVINSYGNKIKSLTSLAGSTGCGNNGGTAKLSVDRTVGLLCQTTSFQNQFLSS